MSMMWIEKHRPKSLDDFHCYHQEITKMSKWIKELRFPEETTPNSLFLSGSPGIGKTTMARLLLQSHNYFVIELNASDIRSQKAVQLVFKKALQSFDVLQLQNSNHKMVAIIMDEVDGMSSGDRGGLSELTDLIKQFQGVIKKWITEKNKLIEDNFTPEEIQGQNPVIHKHDNYLEIGYSKRPKTTKVVKKAKSTTKASKAKLSTKSQTDTSTSNTSKTSRTRLKKIKIPYLRISPIINISNVTVDKKLHDLKKHSLEINLEKPRKISLEKTCASIIEREKMNLTPDAFQTLIGYSQSDFRKLLMIMEELYRNFGTSEINGDKITHFFTTIQKKQIDLTIFEATKLLYQKYPKDSDMIYYYETDRSLISMMLHENIYNQINLRKAIQSDKIDSLIKIIHHFSLGDIIDKYIYNFQCWNLQELNGFIKCSTPSFYLNQFPTKKKTDDSPLNFTTVLSRQAVQLNNLKMSIIIKKKCRTQRRYVNQISALLTQRLRFPEIESPGDRDEISPVFFQLAKRYDIELSNLEKMLKFQTWDLSPIHITKKNRNIIKKKLESE